MNHHSRQNAKNSVEKDFLKLLNNVNFGYDCCYNLDNYKFIPIFDELNEVTYLKTFYNLFDQTYQNLFLVNYLRKKLMKILTMK